MEEQYIHVHSDGSKFYYKDKVKTILHRLDGPAVEHDDGYKEWYRDGYLHREDGPAIEHPNGRKEWYINDIFIMKVDKEGKIIKRMV